MLNWHGVIHTLNIKTWKVTWSRDEQHSSILYTAASWTQTHLLLFAKHIHLTPQTKQWQQGRSQPRKQLSTAGLSASLVNCYLITKKLLQQNFREPVTVPHFRTTKREGRFGEVTTNAPLRVKEVLIRGIKKIKTRHLNLRIQDDGAVSTTQPFTSVRHFPISGWGTTFLRI